MPVHSFGMVTVVAILTVACQTSSQSGQAVIADSAGVRIVRNQEPHRTIQVTSRAVLGHMCDLVH